MKIVEDYAQRKVDEVKKVLEKELQVKNDELVAKEDELVAKEGELVAKDEKFEKSKQNFVINLDKEGYDIKDIARIADVSLDFVSRTLSK